MIKQITIEAESNYPNVYVALCLTKGCPHDATALIQTRLPATFRKIDRISIGCVQDYPEIPQAAAHWHEEEAHDNNGRLVLATLPHDLTSLAELYLQLRQLEWD